MYPISGYRHFIFLSTLLYGLLTAPIVIAQPGSGAEFRISGSLLHFDYQEFNDSGKLLDHEEGFIPGLALNLSNTFDQWTLAGDLSYHAGDVPYVGYTNTGLPITTTTRQNIADLALRAEYWRQSDNEQDYAVYFGTGYHLWGRDILSTTTTSGAPVSGLYEIYTWWTGFLGIKAGLYHAASNSLIVDIRLLKTIMPDITVYFANSSNNVKLPLGERWGAKLALPWRSALGSSSSLLIEPYTEFFELGRSPTVGGIYEPNSQTFNYGLTVGIAQKF